MTETLEDRLADLDVDLLERIESQTSLDDKRSLLALHGASRDAFGRFCYLEIGSHLGGSLQSFVADPRCEAIVSIDPRPAVVPDERWEEGYAYPDNSTERMLGLLKRVPGADLAKLRTIEATTADISPQDVSPRPHLCFIDGEHTNPTASRDADFCRAALRLPGAIAFHDNTVVGPAIGRFLSRTGGFGYPLRDNLFVVEFGGDALFRHPLVQRMVPQPREWVWANRLGVAHRVTHRASPVQVMRDRGAVRTRLRGLLGVARPS